MRIGLGGHDLRVEVDGTAPPTFVCLHGLADTGEIWKRLRPALTERGQVIVVDQRAHGASDAPAGPYRREDLAADVVGVLDALGIERAVLVGHSMGGIVAMTTALAAPERVQGLVLIGTASQCNEKIAGWYERIARAAETDGLDGFRAAIYGKTRTRPIEGDPAGLAHVTRCLRSLYDDPLKPRLGAIRCPVLLLVGDRDPMGPGASVTIQRQIADAQLEIVPERGHWLHVEAPDAVVAALDRHLMPHVAPA